MKIGIQCFFGGASSAPDHIIKTAQMIENCGYHSLWVPEHVVFFHEQNSTYPYSSDGRLPVDPRNVPLEPLTALSFIAAHTSRVRLGTGITILPQRNPVYTAKQAADVDVLSGGRLDFGVGLGWLEEEFEVLNVPFAKRGARTADYLEVMLSLWRDDISSFKGDYYNLPECVQGPKPVQKPHPPIYFGGESIPALRRVAKYGQGWYGVNVLPEDMPPHLERLKGLLAEEGRTLDDVEIAISPYGKPCDLDMLKAYRDQGVAQVIIFAMDPDAEVLHGKIEGFAEQLVVPGAAL